MPLWFIHVVRVVQAIQVVQVLHERKDNEDVVLPVSVMGTLPMRI